MKIFYSKDKFNNDILNIEFDVKKIFYNTYKVLLENNFVFHEKSYINYLKIEDSTDDQLLDYRIYSNNTKIININEYTFNKVLNEKNFLEKYEYVYLKLKKNYFLPIFSDVFYEYFFNKSCDLIDGNEVSSLFEKFNEKIFNLSKNDDKYKSLYKDITNNNNKLNAKNAHLHFKILIKETADFLNEIKNKEKTDKLKKNVTKAIFLSNVEEIYKNYFESEKEKFLLKEFLVVEKKDWFNKIIFVDEKNLFYCINIMDDSKFFNKKNGYGYLIKGNKCLCLCKLKNFRKTLILDTFKNNLQVPFCFSFNFFEIKNVSCEDKIIFSNNL